MNAGESVRLDIIRVENLGEILDLNQVTVCWSGQAFAFLSTSELLAFETDAVC